MAQRVKLCSLGSEGFIAGGPGFLALSIAQHQTQLDSL